MPIIKNIGYMWHRKYVNWEGTRELIGYPEIGKEKRLTSLTKLESIFFIIRISNAFMLDRLAEVIRVYLIDFRSIHMIIYFACGNDLHGLAFILLKLLNRDKKRGTKDLMMNIK